MNINERDVIRQSPNWSTVLIKIIKLFQISDFRAQPIQAQTPVKPQTLPTQATPIWTQPTSILLSLGRMTEVSSGRMMSASPDHSTSLRVWCRMNVSVSRKWSGALVMWPRGFLSVYFETRVVVRNFCRAVVSSAVQWNSQLANGPSSSSWCRLLWLTITQ